MVDRLALVELVFVVLFVIGVGLVYLPAAFLVAGALGVWACERESARSRDKDTT